MSSSYVRQMIKDWLRDPTMGIKFYNTINEEQDPLDEFWCTVSFGNPFREVATFCEGSWTEEGEMEVIYFGPPGVTDDAFVVAVEADVDKLMAKRDAANKMVLIRRSAPFEFSDGSADQKYALSIYIDYTFYS